MSITTTASLAGETERPLPICLLCRFPIEGLVERDYNGHGVRHAFGDCPDVDGVLPGVVVPNTASDPLSEAPGASLDALDALTAVGRNPLDLYAPVDPVRALAHEFLGDARVVVRRYRPEVARKLGQNGGFNPIPGTGTVVEPSIDPVARYGSKRKRA